MPVHVLLEGTGPQIPAHLTRIPISLITTSTDVTDKIVKVCYSKPKNKIYKVPMNVCVCVCMYTNKICVSQAIMALYCSSRMNIV